MITRLVKYAFKLSDSDSRLVLPQIPMVAAGLVTALLVGCGGNDSTPNSTTSNDEIAAFIEENPEYGNSPPAAGKPAKSSGSAPLGLER